MNVVLIKLPIGMIYDAVKTARDAGWNIARVDARREILRDDMAIIANYGASGIEKRDKVLSMLERVRAGIYQAAQTQLDALRAAALESIDEQLIPAGTDIIGENAADLALIEHGLLDKPEQLERILEKHENAAFRIAAARFAKEKGWNGFDFVDLGTNCKEYTSQIFDQLSRAAALPTGTAFLQYVNTPTEYRRIARAYGIEDCFDYSGGEMLQNMNTIELPAAGVASREEIEKALRDE